MNKDYNDGWDYGYGLYWRNRKVKPDYYTKHSEDWQRGYDRGHMVAWHEDHDGDEMLVADEHELYAMMGEGYDY